MKDAVGSSFMFMIILGFLAVYIVFMGVIMNYASTYRTSNYVLSKLENTEGKIQMLGSTNNQTDSLCNLVRSNGYYNQLEVCCMEQSDAAGNLVGSVFKIKTNVAFNIPVIDYDVTLKINNETKTIYNVSCSNTPYQNYLCSEGEWGKCS